MDSQSGFSTSMALSSSNTGQDEHEGVRIVLATEAAAGGVRRYLQCIVPGLVNNGVKVDLILATNRAEPDLGADVSCYQALGCRIASISIPSLRFAPIYFSSVLKMRSIIKRWDPDVIHLHAAKAGLVGRLAAIGLGKRVMYSPHAFVFEQRRHRLLRWLTLVAERRLAGMTDRFVFVSEAERMSGLRELPINFNDTCVIENGLPDDFVSFLRPREEIRQAWGLKEEDIVIGAPGRLTYQKGQDWLIDALALIDNCGKHVCVVFCGTGPEEAQLRIQAERKLKRISCRWLGYVPELRRCYRAFDLVVLPSRYEGLAYTLLEACGADVPIIVSNIPANLPRATLRDLIASVPVGNTPLLAQCIDSFLRDRQGWADAARNAGEAVRREFRAEKQVSRLAALYRAAPRSGYANTALQ